jgi:uncharacterized RDD family membrane protein YckC
MVPESTSSSGAPSALVPGVDFVPAPATTRVLAWVLDLVASVVITLALYSFLGGAVLRALGPYSFLGRTLELSFLFMGVLGYWGVVPAASGSTPGRMLFGLRMVPERDRPIGLAQVLLHELVGPLATAATLGLGFLSAGRDPAARTLADRLAGVRTVQFTPPRPEVYQVQDLTADPATGRLYSTELGLPPEPTAIPAAEPGDSAAPPGERGPSEALEEPAAVRFEAPPPAAPAERPPGATRPVPPPVGGTLYARPREETAWERKQRAARGPGVPELAEALRNTARLVNEGAIMPKVLERKRSDFVERMRTVDLGPNPREAVQTIIRLGHDLILSREELQAVHEILKRRLTKSG